MTSIDPLSDRPGAVIGQQYGQYTVSAYIGESSFGRQFRATTGQEDSVLTFLAPRFTKRPGIVHRIQKIMEPYGVLRHPNVCRVPPALALGTLGCLVEEWSPGTPLDRIFGPGRTAPMDKAVTVCARIAAGISHANTNGLMHRDLTPNAILFAGENIVKVRGFGLATVRQVAVGSEMHGDPAFMAPEQIRHPDVIERQSDIYAIGAICFFLLSGYGPYKKGDGEEILAKMESRAGVPLLKLLPETTPPALIDVLSKALEMAPSKRFRNGEALRKALLECFHCEAPRDDAHSSSTVRWDVPDGYRPYLRIFGPRDGCVEVNLIQEKLILGRAESAEIRLEEKAVSRQHAALVARRDGYAVEDLDSTAGTLLNGQPVTETTTLKHGDTLQIASFVIQYRTDERSSESAMAAIAGVPQHAELASSGMTFNALPSSMRARYRTLQCPPQDIFASGDTLRVGAGGIMVPQLVQTIDPVRVTLELELTWPGGQRRKFLGECLGTTTLVAGEFLLVKLHRTPKRVYEQVVGSCKRGEWVVASAPMDSLPFSE